MNKPLIKRLCTAVGVIASLQLGGCASVDPQALALANSIAATYATVQQGRALGAQATASRAQAELARQQAATQALQNRILTVYGTPGR